MPARASAAPVEAVVAAGDEYPAPPVVSVDSGVGGRFPLVHGWVREGGWYGPPGTRAYMAAQANEMRHAMGLMVVKEPEVVAGSARGGCGRR